MKKLLTAFVAAALLTPALAQADMYYYREAPSAYYSDLNLDRERIVADRSQLARDQDMLARDRAFGAWWSITSDSERVRQDQVQLDNDLTAYDSDRGILPRTYTYHYYRY